MIFGGFDDDLDVLANTVIMRFGELSMIKGNFSKIFGNSCIIFVQRSHLARLVSNRLNSNIILSNYAVR